jgi:hypothetical protein
MNQKTRFLNLIVVMFSFHFAQSSNLRLGQPIYGGTGCPAGSAAATLSPSEDAISILFDQYWVEAGGVTTKNLDRKSCNVAIPVYVPQGYSVAIFSIDYRGFVNLPSGSYAALDSEYFWAGIRGPIMRREGFGPLNTDYVLRDEVRTETLVWSPCGQSINLRVNTSLQVKTNSRFEQTLATVDSADITSGLVYHLQWRNCF